MIATLEVTKYLRQNSLAKLVSEYDILVRQSELFPELYLLKYNQISSDMSSPLVQECRGIIVSSSDNWNPVAMPFKKFFNESEHLAAKIDWESARVQEKLDGSLITMYWYGGAWQCASSGNPDAAGEVNGSGMSFRQLFFDTLFATPTFKLDSLDPTVTYIFELMSPYNRVVVRHQEPKIALIGARNILDLQEIPVESVDIGVPVVKSFPLKNLKEIEATFQKMDPLSQEGYVVVDSSFNRVKVKSPAYVALHHLRGEAFTPKRALALVLQNETEEFLGYFPEFSKEIEAMRFSLVGLLEAMQNDFKEITTKVNSLGGGMAVVSPKIAQKEFAALAVKTPYADGLFQLRAGKAAGFLDYLKNASDEKVLKLLENF